jgi:hypothetical protein
MRFWPALICFSIVLLPSQGLFARNTEKPAAYPVTYEGGSLPLSHARVSARFANGEVVFVQHGQRFAVPVESITEITCGSDVHRRIGFVRHVPLNTVETDYIGVTWTDASSHDVLLKLNSREYRDFLAALEKWTGRKAVDPKKVPVVVHYDL